MRLPRTPEQIISPVLVGLGIIAALLAIQFLGPVLIKILYAE